MGTPVAPAQPENGAIEDFIHDIPVVVKETKAGYKTTEFWLTILSIVIVNLNGVVLTLPDKYQALATAFLAGIYALARGLAKKGVPDVESPA